MNDATDDTSTHDGSESARAESAAGAVEGNGNGPSSSASGAGSADAKAGAAGAKVGGDADSLRADVERFREQWMRSAADFDNFRKRARREIEDAHKAGREDLLRELLPVFDNLERGIQSAQRATDVKAVADGLGMILKQFVDTLGRSGIGKIAGVGSPFDPAIHEAIQQIETTDHPPGVVIAEVQPGYVQGERLIRAAMVVVSKAPAESSGTAN